MKKVLVLILITCVTLSVVEVLFLHPCKAQTNVYHPFPDSDAFWNVSWDDEGCFSSNIPPSLYMYSIAGDTILGSYTYKKIIRNISPCGFCCSPPFFSLNSYVGAFREDGIQKKMYFFYLNDTAEKLLYDFSLAAGDTLIPDYAVIGSPAIITSIDSIIIGASYRKRFNINWGYQYFIEGIGGSWGFIEELLTFDSGSQLLCYSENNHTLYPDTTTDCEIITGIIDDSYDSYRTTISMTVELSPNPATTQLHIQSTEKITSLQIFDITGREIKAVSMNTAEGQTILDVSHLQKGIYVFVFNGSAARKVVIE